MRGKQSKFGIGIKGFTLVEALIIIGIMSILFLGASTLMQQVGQVNTASKVSTSARNIIQNVHDIVRNGDNWKATLLGNKTMDCICNLNCVGFAKPPAAKEVNRRLVLYNSAGMVYYDSTKPQSGFTYSGEVCHSFPNVNCPYHLDLTWRMNCNLNGSTASCPTYPQVEIKGELAYKLNSQESNDASQGGYSFNPKNYAFSLIHPTNAIAGPPPVLLLADLVTVSKFCDSSSSLSKNLNGANMNANTVPSDTNINNRDVGSNTNANNSTQQNPSNGDNASSPNPGVATDAMKKSLCNMMAAAMSNPEMADAIKAQMQASGQGALAGSLNEMCPAQ